MLFGKLHVCTYICIVKLEEAIKSNAFKDNRHKAGLNILYTAWWLKTVFGAEFKKFGLTAEQFNVLRILKGKHPEKMCVKDIGSRMIEKNSNVPRIIDRLEIKKFVKRSTSLQDKRETAILLTEAGINILHIVSEKLDTATTEVLKITEKEAIELNKLLETLRGDI